MSEQNEHIDSPTDTDIENQENLDDLKPEDELDLESMTEEEKDEALLKTHKLNKRIFARAKTAETKLKARPKAAVEPPAPGADPLKKPEQISDADWRERVELKTDGYLEEDVNFIMKNGGRSALSDPYVKGALEKRAEERKAEAGAIDHDDTAKSDIERRYSEAELRAMPVDKLEKILPHSRG